jgi:hypothetical protein
MNEWKMEAAFHQLIYELAWEKKYRLEDDLGWQ